MSINQPPITKAKTMGDCTAAKRQAEYRRRKRESGLKQVRIWVAGEEQAETIRSLSKGKDMKPNESGMQIIIKETKKSLKSDSFQVRVTFYPDILEAANISAPSFLHFQFDVEMGMGCVILSGGKFKGNSKNWHDFYALTKPLKGTHPYIWFHCKKDILTGVRTELMENVPLSRISIVDDGEFIFPLITDKQLANEIKIAKKPDQLPAMIDKDIWLSFVEHRKQIGKKMTENAKALAIKKLEKFKEDGQDPNKILEQSILNGWPGLYEVKPQFQNKDNYVKLPTDNEFKKALYGICNHYKVSKRTAVISAVENHWIDIKNGFDLFRKSCLK